MSNTLSPGMLKGPRSFFTDIDPKDVGVSRETALRSLKLQLLTKRSIIVGASSLFHDEWARILQADQGLIQALNDGIIIPALNYDYKDIDGFFTLKQGYKNVDKGFYIENTAKLMVWDLDFNTSWFQDRIFDAVERPSSLLRVQYCINENVANQLKEFLLDCILNDKEKPYLRSVHLNNVAEVFGTEIGAALVSYGHLIYRMSGARTVDAEGHFPQSNITEINISGSDHHLSDDSIFWDIYAEAVFSNINKSVKITADRLDQLEFSDILNLRDTLLSNGFCEGYDALLQSVKESVDLSDPEKIILHAEEIADVALTLRKTFSDQLKNDKEWFDAKTRAGSMWQMANGLSLLGGPVTGAVMGVVSTLGALPEITAPLSKNLSDQISNRIDWMERFVNSKVGWSKSHKGAFLLAYKELVVYGLP